MLQGGALPLNYAQAQDYAQSYAQGYAQRGFGGDWESRSARSDAESRDTDEERFSYCRFFTEFCSVLPSALWFIALAVLTFFFHNRSCDHGYIVTFLIASMVGFALIIVPNMIEGCYAGEPDFHCSPLEVASFIITGIGVIGIVVLDYWGCIQLYIARDCDENFLVVGWAVLVGNNIMLAVTICTTVTFGVHQFLYAGADRIAGDRLAC